jgi:2-methylcitrate dehydratase PrpD
MAATGITEQLVAFAQAEPDPDARAVMALSALDWAACGIAGAAEGSFDGIVAAAHVAGDCTQFAGGQGAPAAAALINGTLSHALDYDDTHFAHIGHPSVAVVSAALAAGQAAGASLDAIIDAALIGAEASVAVGIWLGRGHYQVGYHQTATAGAFGATIAAGRLRGLSDVQMRHALGVCSTMASGLKSQFGTMGKPLNAGLAARCGIEAAAWAAAGMTSADDGLAGPLGFGPTHHGAGDPVTLGADWRMTRVSHKFHACCHGLHATLEALADTDLTPDSTVGITTHPRWMTVCNIETPRTGLECKFSYAQVAAMAAHGLDTGDIAQFSDATAARADLAQFRTRVRVDTDESLTEMQARVFVDGQAAFHDLDAPMALVARQAKIMKKAHALVGTRADDLWQAVHGNDLAGFVGVIAL